MPKFLLFVLPVLAANRFGPYYSLGPTNSRIIYAETIVVPPAPPNPVYDKLSIWVGVGTPSGARSQGTLMSTPRVRTYAIVVLSRCILKWNDLGNVETRELLTYKQVECAARTSTSGVPLQRHWKRGNWCKVQAHRNRQASKL
jgi:hypothetical protein